MRYLLHQSQLNELNGRQAYLYDIFQLYFLPQIPERCIVITSCMGRHFKKFTAEKEVYVPDIYQDYCLLRDGRPYGFEFDISDAELDLYNASGGIKERIQSAYDRL